MVHGWRYFSYKSFLSVEILVRSVPPGLFSEGGDWLRVAMGVLLVESVFPLRKFSFLFFVHLVKHLKKKKKSSRKEY